MRVLLCCLFALVGSVYATDRPTMSLDEYLQRNGCELTEGHIGRYDWKIKLFRSLVKDHRWIKTIGEIGFNAGHSSDVFLSIRRNIKVISFDIMEHPYVHIGKKYIDTTYPHRHTLIPGNSLVTVERFHAKHPKTHFDLIFIDGGHDLTTALNDIKNMRSLASSRTILVVDDTNYPDVLRAWNISKQLGYVKEIKRINKNSSLTVGRYRL